MHAFATIILEISCASITNSLKSLPSLPHSWDYVPTFAFPGSHDGFLTAAEVKQYKLTQFSTFIIYEYNVSCLNPLNGTITPAHVGGSGSSCLNHSYYPNMETSLQYQAKELKTSLLENSTKYSFTPPVFAYELLVNAQNTYVWQHLFNSDESPYSDWHLTLKHEGTINCIQDGCDWQGPGYRQFDFRNSDVRQWFVDNVIVNLANSTYLDGIFTDTVSCWLEDLCGKWNCTQEEYWELFNASLYAVEDTLVTLGNMGKYHSISTHSDMGYLSNYYWRLREIIDKHKEYKNALRYYEGFETSWGSTFINHFGTLMNETGSGLGVHVHAAQKTLNPDWVELGAFLIAANNQSWFAYSGWTVESGWYQAEFNKSLGNPLTRMNNCTNIINRNNGINGWTVYSNTSALIGRTVSPAMNTSNDNIVYIGKFDNYTDCISKIDQINSYSNVSNNDENRMIGAFTWLDKYKGEYGNMCYGIIGTDISNWNNPQTYPDQVSARLGFVICQRWFEYCHVSIDPINYQANITWSE